MTPFLPLFGRRGSRWLVGAVCASAAVLVWIGYRAISEWEQAAGQVASRRADAAVNLLVAALTRDMRGVQQLMLTSLDRDGSTAGANSELVRPIGNALARYPYPEVFFAWQDPPTPDSVVFYSRPERRPAWLIGASGAIACFQWSRAATRPWRNGCWRASTATARKDGDFRCLI